ncbi:MAG: hypothetical protein WCH05_02810 [Chlorobiaceae bacterium]
MLTETDFLGFFNSMMKIELHQRNLYHELALQLDDPEISALMESISHEEQSHMDLVQQMIDLVSGMS